MNATVSVTNDHPLQPSLEPVGISSRGLTPHVLPGIFSKKLGVGRGQGASTGLQSYHLDAQVMPRIHISQEATVGSSGVFNLQIPKSLLL